MTARFDRPTVMAFMAICLVYLATAWLGLRATERFFIVMAVTSLSLVALMSDRRRVVERLQRLAVTDPLTGLANYRRLQDVLRVEISRSNRTERPFAMLFVDVDGLKKINDRYGHLAGSRALCRVADTMRRQCRAVDTAARFGGDEFAVVLPDTGEVGAHALAHRLLDQLAHDTAEPRVTVSTGVAVYPRDGGTPSALLGAADQLLYRAKGGDTNDFTGAHLLEGVET